MKQFPPIVFAELVLQIDQKINELVAEQQKIDAKRAHDKSEIEQLKQDIANANKQKQLISKALAKKVYGIFRLFLIIVWELLFGCLLP